MYRHVFVMVRPTVRPSEQMFLLLLLLLLLLGCYILGTLLLYSVINTQ